MDIYMGISKIPVWRLLDIIFESGKLLNYYWKWIHETNVQLGKQQWVTFDTQLPTSKNK